MRHKTRFAANKESKILESLTFKIDKYQDLLGHYYYVGQCREHKCAITQGKTLEEVLKNMGECITVYLEAVQVS